VRRSRRTVRTGVLAEYYRQIFEFGHRSSWRSEKLLREVTLEMVELPPGERAILSLQVREAR
jgi:hypothetical protein